MAEKMRRLLKMRSKAQVTIFIILALIIIVAIVILFILIRRPVIEIEDVENPQAYVESCVREAVEEALEILMPQGGDIEPEGSVMYNGKEITYLCYNSNYYSPCVNQRPMLIEHIEEEIEDYIIPKVNNCFNSLQMELEKKNYEVVLGDMVLETQLQTRQVVVNIDRDFGMSKRDSVRNFDNFKMNLIYPVYELAEIAMEIVNQESHYCNFDVLGFMIIYPEYDIQKFRTGDSDIIYSLREIVSGKEFKFAIRSCVMPAGF